MHMVQRGRNREPCFFGEEDYVTYLHWLAEALKKTRCALHAYALMTHPVHLLLTPQERRDGTQACYFVGTALRAVVQPAIPAHGPIVGQPLHVLPDPGGHLYLLTDMRYLELNPVRAAMVNDPAHYRWRRANALGQFSPRLSPHPV